MLESLLTAERVAQLLNIQKKTVYTWAEQGRIPAYRINKALRFRESDLQEFIVTRRDLSPRFSQVVFGLVSQIPCRVGGVSAREAGALMG